MLEGQLDMIPLKNNVKLHPAAASNARRHRAETSTLDAAAGFQPETEQVLAHTKSERVDWESILTGIFRGKTLIECGMDRNVFRQGQPADSLFYIRRGKVKLTVISQQGKEAIVAILGSGEFFGEGCLAGQPLRMATAIAMTDCTLDKIEKSLMARMLHEKHDVSELASPYTQHPLRSGSRRSAVQLEQKASGPDSAAGSFRQGKQRRDRSSRGKSGYVGADGRHDTFAGQSFHEQVQEAWLYRLRRRRIDGP